MMARLIWVGGTAINVAWLHWVGTEDHQLLLDHMITLLVEAACTTPQWPAARYLRGRDFGQNLAMTWLCEHSLAPSACLLLQANSMTKMYLFVASVRCPSSLGNV